VQNAETVLTRFPILDAVIVGSAEYFPFFEVGKSDEKTQQPLVHAPGGQTKLNEISLQRPVPVRRSSRQK
jgi:hypothetical protein